MSPVRVCRNCPETSGERLLHLVPSHKEEKLRGIDGSDGGDPLVLHKRVVGKDDGAGPGEYKLPTQTQNTMNTDHI